VLSKSLRQAAAWGLIQASPVQVSTAPKAERPELAVPTSEIVQALMAASEGTGWEIPIFLSAVLGTRRGETLALRWEEVDLETARVRIERSLERTGDEFRFKSPKTRRSRRDIALPRFAVDKLGRWRIEQNKRRLVAGAAWHRSDLVCEGGDGRPIDPDSFSKAFKRLARQVGVPDARLHDLRHAAATTLMERGVHPTIVSKTLGHASEAFTMAVYGHVRDEMLDQAATALGDAYGAPSY
jgi:integrase